MFALIAILVVQLVVAALLFGTLLLDRPDDTPTAEIPIRPRSR